MMADVFAAPLRVGYMLLAVVLQVSYCGEHCEVTRKVSYVNEVRYEVTMHYCTYGCCSYEGRDQYCCELSVGAIVGSVFGSLIFVAVVISLICCCLKKQGYIKRAIGPDSRENGVMILQTTTTKMRYLPQPKTFQTGAFTTTNVSDQRASHSQTTFLPNPPSYAYTNPIFQTELSLPYSPTLSNCGTVPSLYGPTYASYGLPPPHYDPLPPPYDPVPPPNNSPVPFFGFVPYPLPLSCMK